MKLLGGDWQLYLPVIFKSLLLTSLIASSRKYFLLCILLISPSRSDTEFSFNSVFLSLHSPGSPTTLAHCQSPSWVSSLCPFSDCSPWAFLLVAVGFRATFLNPHFRPGYKPSDFYFWLLIKHNYLCDSEICENSECQN